MYTIRKTSIEGAEILPINRAQWGFSSKKEVYAAISYDDEGINVLFTIHEKNPRRLWTKHFDPVHEDSCVEFFVNFAPEASDLYFNFETNANGVMNVSIRRDRYDSNHLTLEEVESLGIKAEIFADKWQVGYRIGYDLICRHFPAFDPKATRIVKANLYKCGDKALGPHYLAAYDVGTPKPDFHRPEFFVEMAIERP